MIKKNVLPKKDTFVKVGVFLIDNKHKREGLASSRESGRKAGGEIGRDMECSDGGSSGRAGRFPPPPEKNVLVLSSLHFILSVAVLLIIRPPFVLHFDPSESSENDRRKRGGKKAGTGIDGVRLPLVGLLSLILTACVTSLTSLQNEMCAFGVSTFFLKASGAKIPSRSRHLTQ